jgi:hypothetical protein
MSDIPPIDQFTLPGAIPETPLPLAGGVGGGPVSAQVPLAHPPVPSRKREGEYGTPSHDWRERGLAHPAGRGWEADCDDSCPAPTPNPSRMREGSETCGAEGDVSRSGVGPSDPTLTGTAEWTVLTPQRLAAFLAQLAESGNARLAARAAGVSPQTMYRARRKSAALARAWDAAMLAARPVAEAALADKALNGWEEAVFYRGEEIARRPRFDSRLLLAHLARLDKLAERAGAGGGEAADLAALDEAIETLARGEDLPEVLPDAGAAEISLDCVPSVPSSSVEGAVEAGPEHPPCETCGGRCNGPEEALTQADCQWFGNRLDRMLAARPDEAETFYQLATGLLTARDVEAFQLEAFEAGQERWWELVPPDELDDEWLGETEAGSSD